MRLDANVSAIDFVDILQRLQKVCYDLGVAAGKVLGVEEYKASKPWLNGQKPQPKDPNEPSSSDYKRLTQEQKDAILTEVLEARKAAKMAGKDRLPKGTIPDIARKWNLRTETVRYISNEKY